MRAIIAAAAANPLRFHPVAHGFRRANLKRFPFHVLYEVGTDTVRVLLVRHHKRHPDYGLPRA
ncbi:MAG: type II toxin-antitoxin system RelE/ParE family toxin [Verrucomicrobiales bacterium]|nr:type II toxin-antitoxin system RelE/ParE family toxin [Verrucomicrobiales bacterium]